MPKGSRNALAHPRDRSFEVFCPAAPIWYLPYRCLSEHFGFPLRKNDRVRRANLIDWLNATGCGLFAAAILTNLAQWLRDGAR